MYTSTMVKYLGNVSTIFWQFRNYDLCVCSKKIVDIPNFDKKKWKIWNSRQPFLSTCICVYAPIISFDLRQTRTLQRRLNINTFDVEKRWTWPPKSVSKAPLLQVFWKTAHHKNRNEKLGKVSKFQVFISNNECAADRKPQGGGPIRPPGQDKG